MPPVGFESMIWVSERPQTYALERAATRTGLYSYLPFHFSCLFFLFVYYKLQSIQLDRVISKSEVRKDREAGTIHRWFTGVVLLS